MKVCMLTTGFPRFKGDLFGSFILELAKRLAVQDVDVDVIAPHEKGAPRREYMEGVQVRRFLYMLPTCLEKVAYGGGIPTNIRRSLCARLLVPAFLFGFWWKAVRSVRDCHLVHCHWTISGLIAYLATFFRRRPIVLSVRGSDIHLLEKGMVRSLNRRIYQWMDVVIAVSEDIARKLEQAGVDRDKIRVIYNGVDERFCPGDRKSARRQLGLSEESFIVLFVGLLVPVKGIDVLLEAIENIEAGQLLCILVGEGGQKEDLLGIVEEKGLSNRVKFAGRCSSEEVPTWMNAADVLVLPSFSEGRPNVVLEAQACGLPVIATRVGGTPELICDGENGLLIESGDSGGLAQKLIELMEDAPYRLRMGRAAREGVLRDGLTWEDCGRRVKDIYRDLLTKA